MLIPILPPNTESGATLVNCHTSEGPVGYPEGTQTHAWFNPGLITAITPSDQGCYIYLHGNPTAHYCHITVEKAVDALGLSKPTS